MKTSMTFALAAGSALALLWPASSNAADAERAGVAAQREIQLAQADVYTYGPDYYDDYYLQDATGFAERVTRRGTWSHSTRPNGLCRRNTGVPLSELNIGDRCDTREFWTRQQERAR